MNPTASVNRSCTRKFYQRRYHKSDQRVSTRKMGGGEAPENVKRANAVRYLEQGKMAKIKRRLQRKMLKTPGPKLPAPPPSSKGAPNKTSKVTVSSGRKVPRSIARKRQEDPQERRQKHHQEHRPEEAANVGPRGLRRQEDPQEYH